MYLNNIVFESNIMESFKAIQEININRLEANNNYVLNEDEKAILESAAKTKNGITAYAQAILFALENVEYDLNVELIYPSEARKQNPATLALSNKLILTPNPTNNLLNISFNFNEEIINQLEIVNVLGEQVFVKNNITNSTININVADLNSGIYFVNMLNNNGSIIATEKLIKN